MAASKTGADLQTVSTIGDREKNVQVSEDLATQKAGGMVVSAAALRQTGFLDKSGDITEAGQDALTQKETTGMAFTLSQSEFLGKENKGVLQTVIAKMANAGKNREEVEENVASMVKDGFMANDDVKYDDKGKVVASSITPSDSNTLAQAIGTSQGHKMGESLKTMIVGGTEFRNAGDSSTSTKNNSHTDDSTTNINEGTQVKTADPDYQAALAQNHGDEDKAMQSVRASRAINHALSKQGAITHATGYIGDKLEAFDDKFGTNLSEDFREASGDPEKMENFISSSGTLIATAITGVAYNKALKTKATTSEWVDKKFDSQDPNNIKQEDGSYKDGRGDSFTVDEKGNMVNEAGKNIKEKVTSSKDVGGIKRTWGGLKSGADIVGKLFRNPSSETLNKTTNSPADPDKNYEGNKQPNPVNDRLDVHGNSPDLDKESVPNIPQNNKQMGAEKLKSVLNVQKEDNLADFKSEVIDQWECTNWNRCLGFGR